MSDVIVIGNVVEKNNEVKEFDWEITDFFTVAENKREILSPRFLFADSSWQLRLYPKSIMKAGFMNLLVRGEVLREFSVEYNLGYKKLDGSEQHLKKGTLQAYREWSDNCFFKLLEVQKRKSNLSDVLNILCTLKRKAASSDQARSMAFPEHSKLIKLDTLSENFRSLFLNKDSCDTTLLVMKKEYKAHKAVLMARSTVFAAMFLHDTSEKQTGVVNIPDCDPESFEKFLEFLYTGKLKELSSQNVLHLYETSDKYDVRELKKFCVEFLIENLTVVNLCDIVIFADMYDDSNLSSAAQDFFNENLKDILRTAEWDSLARNNHRLAKKLLEQMSLKMNIFR